MGVILFFWHCRPCGKIDYHNSCCSLHSITVYITYVSKYLSFLFTVTAKEPALFQRTLQQALQRHVDYPRVRCQPCFHCFIMFTCYFYRCLSDTRLSEKNERTFCIHVLIPNNHTKSHIFCFFDVKIDGSIPRMPLAMLAKAFLVRAPLFME